MVNNQSIIEPADTQLPASESDADRRTIRKVVVASAVGTIIEWFDYSLYGAVAGLVINKLFFPALSPTAATLAAFATFAVGFLSRPLGGMIIAHIGDRYGRKPALLFSIILMGSATVALGLLPTWYDIGIMASVLLVILRLLQGFGAGAELAGAQTFVAEYVPQNSRAFYTSLIMASTGIGILCSSSAFFIVTQLPDDVFLSWGWRVPFLISALLFVVAIYIRKNLDETPEYAEAQEKNAEKREKNQVPLVILLKNSWREVLLGFCSLAGHLAYGYVLSVFSLSYMANTLGMAKSDGLLALMIAVTVNTIMTPIMGRLADKYGFTTIFSFGAIFLGLFAFPFFAMLESGSLLMIILAMSIAYGIGHGATSGAQGAFLTHLFPARYRFSGMALSRELNSVIFAGATPLIATALVSLDDGESTLVSFYLIACCTLTLVSVQLARKLRKAQ
ncbi:MFS transporter [Phytobacter sp. V91]|uniref:MFS transporter n=1 Tax=Phytobacter sp. V91 TaxID=3369425 RepID=UPI003F639306